jgi:hypothetical protein
MAKDKPPAGSSAKAAARAQKKAKAAQKTTRKEKKKVAKSQKDKDEEDLEDLEGILDKVCSDHQSGFTGHFIMIGLCRFALSRLLIVVMSSVDEARMGGSTYRHRRAR